MRRINLKTANVARPETIRLINRQIVLNYVRERAPISRAEISQETALQRSTISLIIDELKDQGLLDETEGESTGGRPPILLRLRTAVPMAVGVDIGMERTVVATSDLAGRVLERQDFLTDPDQTKTLAKVVQMAQQFISRHREIEGVGISLPGVIDPEAGLARFIPHFKWRNWHIANEMQSMIGLPVNVDNDANAAALAELWFGRPEIRDIRDFIMVLVHGGLGTGIVFDGQVYHGEIGAAGEFGHMTIGKDGPVACASGSRECWEAFASERAAVARYTGLVSRGRAGMNTTFSEIVELALAGDESAIRALIETAHYLGVGISNLIKGLSPQAVIVGGSITRAWPLINEQLTNSVEDSSICSGLNQARIIPSTLGQPTLMGAISLVLAGKFASVQPA